MTRLVIRVSELRKGDRLVATNRFVEYVGEGVRTKRGKLEVVLEGESGYREWNKRTEVTVDRPDAK